MNIFKKIEEQYKKKLPFVAYKKPNSNVLSAVFQKSGALFYTKNYTEKGFVFAPFDASNPAILIPIDQSEFISEVFTITEKFSFKNTFITDITAKKNHIHIVQKAIEAIKKGELKKVVLSRKELVHLSHFDLITVFKKLLQSYLNAFVYVWFHPKVGLWLGATPETLLQVKGNRFETMALAGTQTYKKSRNVAWKQKELTEQQLVTDFIISNLQTLVSNLQFSEVETVKAGNLLHLYTKIFGNLGTDSLSLITNLHPTPAVCGVPKEASKKFILKNENYNRSYYTGFLGELNFNSKETISETTEKTNLFVNLRCMEIKNNMATIFIGGGITLDSNPEKEWQETVNKTKVMKAVL